MFYFVFAGGPASGKSSVIRILRKKLDPACPVPVFFIPEAFGVIFQGVDPRITAPLLASDLVLLRQYLIARLEVTMIRDFMQAAPNCVMIADRGIFDTIAYCSPSEANLILNNIGEFPRHDMCLYFESAETQRNLDTDVATMRIETDFCQTKQLEKATRAAWETHTKDGQFLTIPQAESIEEKADAVAGILNEILRVPIFS